MTEFQAYVLLALIGFVAIMLIVLALGQRRQKSPSFITAQILEATEAFGKAVQNHAKVNEVVALMEKFQSRPELIRNLNEFSQQLVVAAFLQRIDTLSGSLASLEERLAEQRLKAARWPSYREEVQRLEETLPQVRAELEDANRAAQQFGVQSTS